MKLFNLLPLVLFVCFSVHADTTDLRSIAAEVGSTSGTRIQVQEGLEEVADILDDGTNDLVVNSCEVAEEAYGAGWNGDSTVPTKNALYDKIDPIDTTLAALPTMAGTYYNPTTTIVANLDSRTTLPLQYIRIGDTMIIGGVFGADATAASGTTTQLRITVPVASNFAQGYHCGGSGNVQSATAAPVIVYADTVNDAMIAEWRSQSTGNLNFYFVAVCIII